jgi:hypothetical protein
MEMDLSELACGTNPFGLDMPRDFLRLEFNCVVNCAAALKH